MKILPVVALTVSVIVLLSVIVPVVHNFGNSGQDNDYQYDEYRTADPTIKEAAGAVELVEIDGARYVHALDLGTGTVTHYDGTTESVSVGKGKIDLFFMWGQSNAAYYGDPQPTEATPRPAPGQAYFFGLYYSKADPPYYAYAVHSSNPWSQEYIDKCQMYDCWTDGQMVIGNLLPAFASGYVEETGHRLYWVSAAVGGASLDLFQPGMSSYDYGVEIMHAALDRVDLDKWEVTPVGLGWWHGSADDRKTPQQYVDAFMGMFDAVKAGGLGVKIDHCYLSLTRSVTNPYKAHMLLAERDDVTIVEDVVRSFPAEADDPSYYANNHYSQKGYNLAGYQMGTNTGKAIADGGPTDKGINILTNFVPLMLLFLLLGVGVRAIFKDD